MTSFWSRIQSQPAKFFSLWVAANLLSGFLVGYLETNGLQFMATLILAGAIIGSFQWGVLWLMSNRFRWWALASTLGWIIGALLSVDVLSHLERLVVNILWHQFGLWEVFWINVVNGLVWTLGMAILQSLMLRVRGRFVGIWLLASLLGGVAQGATGAAFCFAFCLDFSAVGLGWAASGISNGLGWAVYGVMTGIAWLAMSRLAISERRTTVSKEL